MSAPSSSGSDHDTLISRFEERWLHGERPRLEDHLGGPLSADIPLLIDLVHIELEYRLKAGEPARVEDYLRRFPRLSDSPAVVAGLLLAEYTLRKRSEPQLALHEYQQRFPAYYNALLIRLAGGPEALTAVDGTERHPTDARLETAPEGYELLDRIGRGGMGVVYRARHLRLNRVVALKLVRAGASATPESLLRFLREAELLARLQHPHVVQVYETGQHQGLPYLVLEFVAGGTLAGQLGKPRPAQQAAELVETLARAVQSAHQEGIIHRDLKPGNILLMPDGTPKIADFGLAHLEGADLTDTGALLGTPSYMAPEQARGERGAIGPATDVYGLGAILYEMLTGRPPFKGETSHQTLRQVVEREPVAPRRLNPNVGRDLDTICLKCLEKEPRRRYPSALALADDLRRYLDGRPILARPASAWERGLKWARRYPGWAALAVFVVLAGIGAGVALGAANAYLRAALDQRTAELRAESELRAAEGVERQKELWRSVYLSHVQLAGQFRASGEVRAARDLLERARPTRGEEDLRDFAWRYLWRQCHRERRVLPLGEAGWAVAYAPDGKTLATGSGDGRIRLWDTVTGAIRAELPVRAGHGNGLAFSSNGRELASVGRDGALCLWDVGRRRLRRVVQVAGGDNYPHAVAYSPDGRAVAVGEAKGKVTLRDASSGEIVRSFGPATHMVFALAFCAEGQFLAVAGGLGGLVVWEAGSGREVLRVPALGSEGALAVAAWDRYLAVGYHSGLVRLYDVATGRSLARFRGHTAPVVTLAFAPGGAVLASAGWDSTVRLWHLDDEKTRLVLRGHARGVRGVAFSPGGKELASTDEAGQVRLWDVREPSAGQALRPPLSPAGPVACSPEGTRVALAGWGRSVQVCDARTFQEKKRILTGHTGALTDLAWSADGRWVASASADGTVEVREVKEGRRVRLLVAHRAGVTCLAFAPRAPAGGPVLLATAGKDRQVKVWEMPAGRTRAVLTGHTDEVTALAFAPDGRTLASAGLDRGVRLWDLAGDKHRVIEAEAPLQAVVFSRDGRHLITSSVRALAQREVASGKVVGNFPTKGALMVRLAVGPRHLVGSQEGAAVRVWDLPSRSPRCFFQSGLLQGRATVTADGRRAVITNLDGSVLALDLKTLRLSRPGLQVPHAVRDLVFSEGGRTLITTSAQGGIRVRSFWGLFNYDWLARGSGEALGSWDVASGSMLGRGARPDVEVSCLAVGAKGHELVGGGNGGSLWRWDLRRWRAFPLEFMRPRDASYWKTVWRALEFGAPAVPKFDNQVEALAYSPDGQRLAVVGRGSLQVRDSAGEVIDLVRAGADIHCVAFSRDGRYLAAGHGAEVQLWDLATRRVQRTLRGHRERVRCLAVSPDGTTLASGSDDWQIRLWDLPSGRPKRRLLGHVNTVSTLAWSPSGRTLASGSWDRSVKLWQPASGQELMTLERHSGKVHRVAFAPDGSVLASGGENPDGGGEIYLWRARRN
jgi:WD40 repeat protein